MPDWRGAIPDDARVAYERAGYGAAVPIGVRPALIVVDATYAFVGPRAVSIEEATRRYPGACGPVAWDAVAQIQRLLSAVRQRGLPLLYTTSAPAEWLSWTGRQKHREPTREAPRDARAIVDPIRPSDGDVVLEKLRPSAFHATPLLSLLLARRIDTLFITGGTTSGCVRATALDSFSYGFATIVVEDAVFDRSPLSHAVTLFELGQKYAEVMTTARALEILGAPLQILTEDA